MSPLAALVEKKIPTQLHVTHLSRNLFVHKIILLYQRNAPKVYNLESLSTSVSYSLPEFLHPLHFRREMYGCSIASVVVLTACN